MKRKVEEKTKPKTTLKKPKKYNEEESESDGDYDDGFYDGDIEYNDVLIKEEENIDDIDNDNLFNKDLLNSFILKNKRNIIENDYYKNDLLFFELNIESFIEKGESFIKIYGITKEENSVCCIIKDFKSFLYIDAESQISEKDLNEFEEIKKSEIIVTKTEIIERINIIGADNPIQKYLKITIDNHRKLMTLCEIFEKKGYKIYEPNSAFETKFMVLKNMFGNCWIKINKDIIIKGLVINKKTTCQIEINVNMEDIQPIPLKECMDIPPLRILSFDIECIGESNKFPKAEKDPIITIGMIYTKLNTNFTEKICLQLLKIPNINNVNTFCFEKETNLIRALRKFIIEIDIDILTGYNIINFDIPYILDRANALNINCNVFGRTKIEKSKTIKRVTSNKQTGNKTIKRTNISGRIQFDVYQAIKLEYKLPLYTLNSVATYFLNKKKFDLPYYKIPILFKGTDIDRKSIGEYCMQDCVLPLDLIDKLMLIANKIEMCRVTGCPMDMLLTSGQQKKIIPQLLKQLQTKGIISPYIKPSQGEKFEGALVIDPVSGYYIIENPKEDERIKKIILSIKNSKLIGEEGKIFEEKLRNDMKIIEEEIKNAQKNKEIELNGKAAKKGLVVMLDFASLYPNIIIVNNLCYTTYIYPKNLHLYNKEDYITTPKGHHFLKKYITKGWIKKEDEYKYKEDEYILVNNKKYLKIHIKESLIAKLLTELLNARKQAKKEMFFETDSFRKSVLNARQLALKISCNSVYGFTGANMGFLCWKPISESVCAIGVEGLYKTKKIIEETITKKNGHFFDTKIIGGGNVFLLKKRY